MSDFVTRPSSSPKRVKKTNRKFCGGIVNQVVQVNERDLPSFETYSQQVPVASLSSVGSLVYPAIRTGQL